MTKQKQTSKNNPPETKQGKKEGRIIARKIAEDLDVSVSTVSRAFSPSAVIAPKTRERILAYANTIGYRPNPYARMLYTNKTRLVAIVFSDLVNPFFSDVLTKLTEALMEKTDLQIMLFSLQSHTTPDDILPDILNFQPEFIIVLTATVSFSSSIEQAYSQSHLIFFNRYVPNSNSFAVICDNYQGGWDVADYLLTNHHQYLAFVAGTPESTTSLDRWRGFSTRCMEAGATLFLDEQAERFSYQDGYDGTLRIMKRHHNLDAIFTANDVMALGAIDALRHQLNKRVPEDVSVIGFDNLYMSSWPCHNLSSYHHPVTKMVSTTVKLIRDLDADSNIEPYMQKISGHLVIRKTTQARSQQKEKEEA